MPRKPKQPASGGAVSEIENPIRPQIAEMSGHSSIESLIEEAPEKTGAQRGENGRILNKDGSERAPRKKRVTHSPTSNDNPNMSDPRYREAIAGMTFFGAPRMVKRGFSFASEVADDHEIALREEESKLVDDYFYAVSKHSSFDPMATVIGRVVMLMLLIGELVLTRVIAKTDIGKTFRELFTKENEENSADNLNQENSAETKPN
jgi:hypothetical protein